PPIKGSHQRTKMGREIIKLRKSTLYPLIHVHMTIVNPETNLVPYKRMYEIKNISDDPITTLVHGITSDVEKSFDSLHIRVYDEDGSDLKISSISIDKPEQKEFTTVFNKPIEKD